MCKEKKEVKIRMEDKSRLLRLQTGQALEQGDFVKAWDDLELR